VCNHHNNWDLYINQVLGAYRFAIHRTLRQSPFKLMMGFEPRVPSEAALSDRYESIVDANDYFAKLQESLQSARQLANDALIADQQKKILKHARKVKPLRFQVGDRVWLNRGENQAITQGIKKFTSPREGPYVIEDIFLGHNTARIHKENEPTRAPQLIAIHRLLPYPEAAHN
jgi:hypothetical protein